MASKKPEHQSFRKVLLTLNNPTLSPDEAIEKAKSLKSLAYCAVSLEVSPSGTPHLHIYLVFKLSVRRSTLERMFPGAHIENPKGTHQENVDYVQKSGKWKDTEKAKTSVPGTFREWGELPLAAKSSKVKDTVPRKSRNVVQMIEDGKSDFQIIKAEPGFAQKTKHINDIRNALMRDKSRRRVEDLHIEYIYGPPGSGKTKCVLKECKKSDVYIVTEYHNPYDGYKGEPVILFDMFQPLSPDFSLADLVRLLNPHATQLPARGQNLWACYTKVYFTSCYSPDSISKDSNILESFLRRITNVAKMEDGKKVNLGPGTDFIGMRGPPTANVVASQTGKHKIPA